MNKELKALQKQVRELTKRVSELEHLTLRIKPLGPARQEIVGPDQVDLDKIIKEMIRKKRVRTPNIKAK